MAKIRINRRKEYREALRTYIRMARSLITKLDKEFKKYSRYAFREYRDYGYIRDKYYEDFWQSFYKVLEKNAKTIIQQSARSIRTSRLLKKAEDEVAQVTME